MKLGVVGLPNVGKSTLFNAITNAGAQAANYPFCTIEPNTGVVLVPERASPSISVGSWSRIAAWAGSAGGASAQAGRTSVAGHRFQLTGFSSAMAGRAKAMLSG